MLPSTSSKMLILQLQTVSEVNVKKLSILIGILATLSACTSEQEIANRARRALDDEGYSRIEILRVGSKGFSSPCGKGDHYETEASADNVRGKRVNVTVCCGMNKGCTIRH